MHILSPIPLQQPSPWPLASGPEAALWQARMDVMGDPRSKAWSLLAGRPLPCSLLDSLHHSWVPA